MSIRVGKRVNKYSCRLVTLLMLTVCYTKCHKVMRAKCKVVGYINSTILHKYTVISFIEFCIFFPTSYELVFYIFKLGLLKFIPHGGVSCLLILTTILFS